MEAATTGRNEDSRRDAAITACGGTPQPQSQVGPRLAAVADFIVEELAEVVEAGFMVGGDGDDIDFGEAQAEGVEVGGGGVEVHFVSDDFPGEAGEVFVVFLDLAAEDFQVGHRIAAIDASDVDDEEEQAATGDVAEEFVAEAAIGVSAFDEAGNIGDGAAAEAGELDDADSGLQGGERVGGDLGFGGGEFAEKGGFTGVGEADEADVGDASQFEVENPLLAGSAEGCSVGARLVGVL